MLEDILEQPCHRNSSDRDFALPPVPKGFDATHSTERSGIERGRVLLTPVPACDTLPPNGSDRTHDITTIEGVDSSNSMGPSEFFRGTVRGDGDGGDRVPRRMRSKKRSL